MSQVLTFTAGEVALFNDRQVTINSTKGRWVQITDAFGKTQNVGRASLAPVPVEEVKSVEAPKTGYTGPMLALRDRTIAKAYVKAANGNPCCADELATACGPYKPVDIVEVLITALKLDHNPYGHLNIGQQSMNLRNKARGMIKRGEVTIAEIRVALEANEKIEATA